MIPDQIGAKNKQVQKHKNNIYYAALEWSYQNRLGWDQ